MSIQILSFFISSGTSVPPKVTQLILEILQTLHAFTDMVVVITIRSNVRRLKIDVRTNRVQGSLRFPRSSHFFNGLCWRQKNYKNTRIYDDGTFKAKTDIPNGTALNINGRGWICDINNRVPVYKAKRMSFRNKKAHFGQPCRHKIRKAWKR